MKFRTFPVDDPNRIMRLFSTDQDVGYMTAFCEAPYITAYCSVEVDNISYKSSCITVGVYVMTKMVLISLVHLLPVSHR